MGTARHRRDPLEESLITTQGRVASNLDSNPAARIRRQQSDCPLQCRTPLVPSHALKQVRVTTLEDW